MTAALAPCPECMVRGGCEHRPSPADPYADVPPLDDEPPSTSTGTEPAEKVFEFAVEHERQRQLIRAEAARRLRGDRAAAAPTPQLLGDFLAAPDPAQVYRVDRLLPVGGRVLLSAQHKTGKSTLVANLIRSLADGEPFLGDHDVTPARGRVVLLDDELDERTLRRWLRDQAIEHVDRVAVVSLRGRLSSFDITDPTTRVEWADRLRRLDASFVLLDCLRPVLDALGLDEDKDAGRLLVAFDELLGQAGADEAAVVHHMGHSGERARGSSRILDWPDVLWKLVKRDTDDPSSPRFFSAYGRDVDAPERELGFNTLSRRLAIVGGSRRDGEAEALLPALLDLLAERPGISGRAIVEALSTAGSRPVIQRAVAAAIAAREVRTSPGAKRAVLHWLATEPAPASLFPTTPESGSE